MKTKFLILSVFLAGFATNSFGQSTAYATTTAELVAPISIAKTVDMHFGTVASSATAGTVVLDFAGGRTATLGVTLPATGAAATTAEFDVTGEGTSNFSIALPIVPITLTRTLGGTLTVSDFLCDQGATTVLVSGASTLKIGATLNVPANSVGGIYTNALGTSSALFVTVNYD